MRIEVFVGMKNHAATRHAHRIPHPTFVTTRARPSAWGETGAVKHDFRKNEREILRLDGQIRAMVLKELVK
ncbi:hypothetical protein [Bradyrhizobium sp. STM 3557]|uniref:hypothetical protein n=1 Tax=Bradyrhizobium sp. STM 3557 TaxID=578920 RepID=UPI00388F6ADE